MSFIRYPSTAPSTNDTEVILLRKMLQVLGGMASDTDSAQNLLQKILLILDGVNPDASLFVVKSGDTMTGALTVPGLTVTGDASFTPTWTDGAAHTGLKVNVTDTSSASTSKYVDFQVGGVSQFSINKSDGFVHARLFRSDIFSWFVISDAGTNTSPVAAELYHETTGGAGGATTNAGVSFDFRADSSTTDRQLQARIATLWTDATHATRTSQMRFSMIISGVQTEALRLHNGAVDIRGTTALQINAVAYHNPLTVYAAGTVYTLTATPAAVDFGTTDPVITVNAAGTYAIRARVKVALNGATFAANRTLTLKLRRTNNTAADVANSTTTYIVPIVTTLTNTLAIVELPEVLYTTANTNDSLTIFSDVSALPSAGTISIDEASIIAIRLS